MDELQAYLNVRKKEKGYLFIPYLALGDPDWDTNFEIAKGLLEAGADSIELGLPFSDPSADGPVLQRSFKRVLSQGFTWDSVFRFLKRLKAFAPQARFITMGYANVFYQPGFDSIFKRLYEHNVRGVVIPDIPYEEKQNLVQDLNLSAWANKIAWIDFITPTTTPQRFEKITAGAAGFLYIVSYKGTTGSSGFTLAPMKALLKKLRTLTTIPLVVGFGIRNQTHATEAVKLADGFIVGSFLHEIIEQHLKEPQKAVLATQEAIKGLLPVKV